MTITAPDLSNDVISMSRYLLTHSAALRHHDAADQIHRDITSVVHRSWLAVDLPSWKHFTVGPCAEIDEAGDPCPGEVVAHLPADPNKSATLTCSVCAATYDSSQWRRIGQRIMAMHTDLETRRATGMMRLLDMTRTLTGKS